MCAEKRTGRKQKYTEKQILEAIKGSAGIKTTIIKKLGITYPTFQVYLNKYKTVRDALLVEEETVLDMAEGNLFKLIQNGDTAAIFYYLNNKGKKRGYGYQREKLPDTTDAPIEERVTGVLETPGMISEEAWEKAVK